MTSSIKTALAVSWCLLFGFGCAPAPAGCAGDACTATPLRATLTQTATATNSSTPTPTSTATTTPTRIPTASTPLPSPAFFQTKRLLQEVKPQEYVADQCTYLRNRWDPALSSPGTIVVPVMYHGVGGSNSKDNNTPLADFKATIQFAQQMGYTTITMREFLAFLETNARIPPRSMVWIIDDRTIGTVENYFISPEYTPSAWTFSSAWPIADTKDDLWKRVKAAHDTGRLEVQAHGYLHNYPLVDGWLNFPPENKLVSPPQILTTEQFLDLEIVKPISIIKEKIGEAPTVFVWPGGGFSKRAVAAVRQAGYRAGFTAVARGPVMFNWVPLGKDEIAMKDPVMVLPRHWGAPGLVHQLQESALMGEEALSFARKNFPQEAAYFRAMCGAELPTLPDQPTSLPAMPTKAN
jgi:hypothetical protein